ncbi:hypothetical protein [Metapseudomonas otitidis]|jgi:hypothetical protein|uniref:hypothetical protein n=1 Tax=Metapseudomonas otitidis TaxID=319939 RepID=UPI001CA3E08A|nr:hypothetical protein [Pseudomonas otitidis]QZX85541.1 hypothetical protein K6751_12860 [Pseudomonas otitidis]
MNTRLLVIAVTPCGCDAEGELLAQHDDGTPLRAYYQGSARQALARFVPGRWMEIELTGRLCQARATETGEPRLVCIGNSFRFHAYGPVSGWTQRGDDTHPVLQAGFPLALDIESPPPRVELGQWLEVTGELWVEE